MGVTLIVGGARSGKSSKALELARRHGDHVSFIATGQARDAEMAARIDRHRRERPEAWNTIEAPIEVVSALARVTSGDCLIIDCMTLWVSNCLEVMSVTDIEQRAVDLATAAARRDGLTIVVSNEVGSGVVPVNRLARTYVDLMGRVNAIWSEVAATMLVMVAGRALEFPAPTVK
ncbi:MAG: bifunctional adenosylcobinamide kinase/adenosylcobinamide-phosphate guanylyltransferase [Acidobacteria bacterium]|nr:bifunctional adenosylcobinamide kinase/adenosylcobinamide-phosphate guanylyltransferase [Acidobacteriota bacterium]